MNHYLVTGGAGFVGSNLVADLMKKGHKVTVLDNLFTGKLENLSEWLNNPNFKFIKGDVIDPNVFSEYETDPAKDSGKPKLIFTHIFHLACPASPPAYMHDPIHTLQTCFLGTMYMLELASKQNARMLFTSTSEIYGDPEVTPQPETYWGQVNCRGPRSCYDEGKRSAETLCLEYREKRKVEIRVARLFNCYGPNMDPNDGRVVSNMIIAALTNKPLQIYGDGKQTRSFTYVSDTIRGLELLIESDYKDPVNLGNPSCECTIGKFAEVIRDAVGNQNVKIENVAAVIDDPQKRRPNIEVAERVLGWHPEIPLEEGLRYTIEYYKTIIAKQNNK